MENEWPLLNGNEISPYEFCISLNGQLTFSNGFMFDWTSMNWLFPLSVFTLHENGKSFILFFRLATQNSLFQLTVHEWELHRMMSE